LTQTLTHTQTHRHTDTHTKRHSRWTITQTQTLTQTLAVTRHACFIDLAETAPHSHMVAIADKLGPDELYDGMATGVPPPPVIILMPKPSVIIVD
jgi:hypothetical protein